MLTIAQSSAEVVDQGEIDPFAPAPTVEHGAHLEPVALEAIPETHPVRIFAGIYSRYGNTAGGLLPHEDELVRDADALPLFAWAKHVEPIELDGGVDFKVLRQGERVALRERRTYRDQWMSATLDGEFIQARYREIIAASVLRRPLYSRGATPNRQRSFLYLLRGVFPVFAENSARLRLFQFEAEPYVEL